MFGCSTPKTCAELKGSYLIQTSGTAYYSSSKISLQTKLRFYWASFKMPIMQFDVDIKSIQRGY